MYIFHPSRAPRIIAGKIGRMKPPTWRLTAVELERALVVGQLAPGNYAKVCKENARVRFY